MNALLALANLFKLKIKKALNGAFLIGNFFFRSFEKEQEVIYENFAGQT